jgi:hypothetical protein
VGFTLLAMRYDICTSPGGREFGGTGSVKLRLELYSNKLKRIVYAKTLEGSFASKEKIRTEAFDDGLFNAALDVAFSDKAYIDQFCDTVQAVGAKEKIEIANGKRVSQGVEKNSKALLGAVVTIEGPLGTGSGFYVGFDEQLNGTVTRGIVSAERVVNEQNFIQSDAAINPGNSGGLHRVDERMLIAVHNQGTLIPSEEQAKLFTPFHRTAAAQQSGKKGWGLGLTLVKALVEAHGVMVKVESYPKEGTTFTVDLPVQTGPGAGGDGQA